MFLRAPDKQYEINPNAPCQGTELGYHAILPNGGANEFDAWQLIRKGQARESVPGVVGWLISLDITPTMAMALSWLFGCMVNSANEFGCVFVT